MDFINSDIKEINNPASLVEKLALNSELYLDYYTSLRYDDIKELIDEFETHNFFTIRGGSGCGKTSFKTITKELFTENTKIFEYNCNEITELDDIFLKLYKFILDNPIKTDILRTQKSAFKPNSIDEQILHYLKNFNGNLVLIFDNFEKILDDNAELKTENIKSFFEFLSTLKNIKTILISSINIKNALEFDENILYEIRLSSLDEAQIKEFMKVFGANVPQSLFDEIYEQTYGYIFSIKYLTLATKILQLPMAEILKEAKNKNTEIDKLVSKKLISKLSMEAKKILYYFAFFRHEISANILKTIDHFPNIQKELDILKEYMLIEGERNFSMRSFLKELLYDTLPQKEVAKLHEKIADFYAEQIPLKPNERVVEISRSSMYSEKFYHYNIFSKMSKNFELNQARTAESKFSKDMLSSENIKYIASTKYFPDFEIKHKNEDESKNTEQEIKKDTVNIDIDANDINLTDEEKAMLEDYSDINLKENDNNIAINNQELEELKEENYQYKAETTYDDDFEEITESISDENKQAENLLNKGLSLFNEGNSDEAIIYLKNATSFFQDTNKEKYFLSKFTLAKALSENFKLTEASNTLTELIEEGAQDNLLADVLFELGLIEEYRKNNKAALNCYTAAINIANDSNLTSISPKIYFQMALMFDEMNDIENALQYYLLTAEEANISNETTILASSYANIASIYEEKGNTQEAILNYKKSLTIDEKNNNYEGQAKTLSALGNIHLNNKEINIAINLFIKETQVAKKTTDNYLIASSYLELGDTFIKKQDYKNALKAYLLAKKNIDSTISTDSKNKIERRFDMIVDEIGENAYKFLLRELKNNG